MMPASRQPSAKLSSLTRRERQVLELVVAGKFNKTIADVLGISTKTVELHRSSVMTKLGVRNVPDLVKVFLGYQ
jgi:two-component system response regulator FixJ